jgi:MFS family permease
MVSFWGILILSLGLGALTFVDSLWQFYLFFSIGRMVAVGVLSLAISVSVANWFVRYRGRAMGITRVGDRLGSALLPLMVQFLILALGWRLAWGTLGIVVFLISGIPALVFLRHRPEDMGLLPDGAPPLPDGPGDGLKKEDRRAAFGADPEPLWTRVQATRTGAFWMLTLISSLIPFQQAGINFHLYPFLTDQGFSETTSVLILSTVAVTGMLGAPVWGALTERFRIQHLMAANVVGNGLLFLALYWTILFKVGGPLGIGIIFLLASLHGIFHGGRNPMLPVIWADFFGRRSLGSIYSLANPFYFAANALGPIFAGLCFDLLGSYAFPFYSFVVVFFLTGVVTLRMRPPQYPSNVPER